MGTLLSARINGLKPDIVLGTGLYRSLPKMGVTKLAANFKFTTEKDNAGASPKGGRMDENEPDGIFISIDSEGLGGEGVPAMLLLSAPDAYLCNLSMFVAAERSKKEGFACGFIHLPLTEEFLSKNPKLTFPGMSFATMLKGIEAAVGYCAAARNK